MTRKIVLIRCFFDTCCFTTPVTVVVLLQPDMVLIGLSCVVLRHGLADMERSQVTPVTLVLDTSTAQSRLTESVLNLNSG